MSCGKNCCSKGLGQENPTLVVPEGARIRDAAFVDYKNKIRVSYTIDNRIFYADVDIVRKGDNVGGNRHCAA